MWSINSTGRANPDETQRDKTESDFTGGSSLDEASDVSVSFYTTEEAPSRCAFP